jgi:hypothetical protein
VSEYQYYEFLALDRPLTDAEFGQVRALSTRAQVNRTRFVNEYQWGDFRGNPSTLMDRYYDAHLYFANWGTRILMLRLPATLLDLKTAKTYCDSDTASARRSGKNVVLEWRSDDEDGEEDWENGGPGPLAALVAVRAELAAGDLRPLYLAWLASVSVERDEWSDDDEWADDEDEGDDTQTEAGGQDADRLLEPPVPPGLGRLTAAQTALVDFLRVDPDLLAAAVSGAPDLAPGAGGADGPAVDSWIKGLTGKQKDQALRRLLADDDPHARAELLRTARASIAAGPGNARRAVSELLATATMRADARENARQRELDKQRVQREEQARQQRERRIDELALQGERPWNEVNALVAAKKASAYDSAVALLSDLEKISMRGGDPAAFARRLAALRAAHQRKPSFIDRLDAAGLP